MESFFKANRKFVASTTAEAVRLARLHDSGPVRPFAWSFYHNGSQTLAAEDVLSVLEGAYQPPEVDGILWWGDPAVFHLDAF